MNRTEAIAKLEQKLKNPDHRTIEENAPVIVLKNGKHIMVEKRFPAGYTVSRDFGCTCRQLGIVDDLGGVLDLIMAEGKVACAF